ncbi:MAG: ethanolamine ammonia-lyase reactivating factor EutA [Betaproteobacteria bacterium]|nr:ethanolamine ammonia-lyase reactivating factor EutA [Betaproteobacteria bacterium]
MSIGEKGAIAELIWKLDNIKLTTVGIDIGSSTSHLMFAKVHLQRKTQMLSSQFVVIDREIIWRSPILLTPFLPDNTIDADRLRVFIEDAYRESGLAASDIDSGAVILTGEAIKRTNASAIAELFAADSGKFVCASAGHHLECMLAANGSGAVALSRKTSQTILHVDIGGGTTKLALIKNGEILGTCTIAVGGRLIAQDEEGRLVRIDDSAHLMAKAQGIELRLGEQASVADVDRVIDALSNAVIALIRQKAVADAAEELYLTPPFSQPVKADVVTFSGGVSEYIYRRENGLFGDMAKPLADNIGRAFRDGRIAVSMLDPGEGIRATVIGASQFTVQVSGRTIHISNGTALPVHNVPVLSPSLPMGESFSVRSVAEEVSAVLSRAHMSEGQPIALALKWRGDPHYSRLRNLAEGITLALATGPGAGSTLILIVDGDIGKTLGHIIEHELDFPQNIVSIDGVQLRAFDYVDIGEVIQPSDAVPVVIKSLLFSAGQQNL